MVSTTLKSAIDQWRPKAAASLGVALPYGGGRVDLGSVALDPSAVPSAVLILLGFKKSECGYLPHLLYTKRTETVDSHRGQVAFPGGRVDPEDHHEPSLEEPEKVAALRETEEEMGISRDLIEVVGMMPHLYTATGYRVRPVVGILREDCDLVTVHPNEHEIARWDWISFGDLLTPGVFRFEDWRRGGVNIRLAAFELAGLRIWGATGEMTHNFLKRLGFNPT